MIFPVSAKTFVPLLFSVPYFANSDAPLRIIQAILAKVSTLFILVGLPHNPELAGYGGLIFGIPLLPSIEAIIAVSSPQTNAPAPSFISIFRLKSESKILFPRKPRSSACLIAILSRFNASGYSALQ